MNDFKFGGCGPSGRFEGIERPYSVEDVALRGSVPIEYTLARRARSSSGSF